VERTGVEAADGRDLMHQEALDDKPIERELVSSDPRCQSIQRRRKRPGGAGLCLALHRLSLCGSPTHYLHSVCRRRRRRRRTWRR
jgi:hypothetical protein